jgi:hypothetical protein
MNAPAGLFVAAEGGSFPTLELPFSSQPPPLSQLQAERSLPDEFLLEVDLERLRLVEVKQPTLQALLQGEAANQVGV